MNQAVWPNMLTPLTHWERGLWRDIGGEFIDFLLLFVLYFFIIQVIKLRKLICAEHVACMVRKRNRCTISEEKPDEETAGNKVEEQNETASNCLDLGQ